MRNHKKEDRRIRKTKDTIKTVLIDLMETKPFHEITVSELTNRADINRGTFYLHYTDINELLDEIKADLLREMSDALQKYSPEELKKDTSLKFIEMFRFIEDHDKICRILLSSQGDEAFMDIVIDSLKNSAYMTLTELYGMKREMLLNQFFTFGLGGCIALAKAWLDEGCQESAEIMGRRCDEFLRLGREVLK